jgi:hypothetical protein
MRQQESCYHVVSCRDIVAFTGFCECTRMQRRGVLPLHVILALYGNVAAGGAAQRLNNSLA